MERKKRTRMNKFKATRALEVSPRGLIKQPLSSLSSFIQNKISRYGDEDHRLRQIAIKFAEPTIQRINETVRLLTLNILNKYITPTINIQRSQMCSNTCRNILRIRITYYTRRVCVCVYFVL